MAPVRGTDGAKFIVLGQIRPTTWATLLRVDLVGQVVRELRTGRWSTEADADREGVVGPGRHPRPACRAGWRRATRDSRDTGEVPAVPDTAQLECVPVRHGGDPVAVIVRVAPLEDRRARSARTRLPRPLPTAGRTWWPSGDFPFMGEDFTTEDAPRVGDGLVLVEPDGQDRYASPNAMSALHRMGVSDAVEGRRLSELGIDDTAVDWALRAGCPVTEEVERRPDVIVLMQCTPLLEQGTVTGAMVLLRDVTDLRRLDRLLLSKDAAIREVHHRVKNNLQTISSLLRLQARRLEPGKGQEALREAERRVRSIALVHEILSREPGDEVPFDEIVGSLVRMAEDSVRVGRTASSIQVTGDVGEVAADVATPLAVVLAELLQNAVEHAFPVASAADSRVRSAAGRRATARGPRRARARQRRRPPDAAGARRRLRAARRVSTSTTRPASGCRSCGTWSPASSRDPSPWRATAAPSVTIDIPVRKGAEESLLG